MNSRLDIEVVNNYFYLISFFSKPAINDKVVALVLAPVFLIDTHFFRTNLGQASVLKVS